jgi:predicted alpha/beta hydrolase
LGGQLALLYGASYSDQIAGVVLIASGTVHLPCYPITLRAGIRALLGLARWSRATLGYFPGKRLGFGGREASGVMQDWGHVARTGRYEPVGSTRDYEMAIATLRRPVLGINFAADSWAPARAGKGLLDKLQAQSAVHWFWSTADTKGVVLDHFSWLKHPELVAPAVARFMVERPRRR